MSLREKIFFMRQVRSHFHAIGAIIPTSRYAARAMAAECSRITGNKHVLEVGAGTGSITAEIIPHITANDHLVVCEINPRYAHYLRQRFTQEPAFQRVQQHATVFEGSILDMDDRDKFDCIVSAIPFTSSPPAFTEAILMKFYDLLKPGGTLTYIEYALLRPLKYAMSTGEKREQADKINAVLDCYIKPYQFRRDLVWRNVPPAWIRHLRFTEVDIPTVATWAPLAHTHRVDIGSYGMADDALPFIGLLSILALFLRKHTRMLWLAPLVMSGVVGWFLRDPERHINVNNTVAYACSDGHVLSIERLHDDRFGKETEEWLRIAVFMSLTNVHINRTPIAGKMVEVFEETGGNAIASSGAAEHNNACYTVIEGVHGTCVVAQRTGMVARRIVNYSTAGTLVAQGERFGLIRFGSRTDVYLPANDVVPCVTVGEAVQSGITILARYTDDTPR